MIRIRKTRVRSTVAGLFVLAITVQAQRWEFEVATVKQSPPPPGDLININLGTIAGNKLTLTNATLGDCIKFAYSLSSDNQIAAPEWIKGKAVRFDIVAQAPPGSDRDQMLQMLQTLLHDRLRLEIHREQKELPHLVLLLGKNGPKLRQSEGNPVSVQKNTNFGGRISAHQMSMAKLVSLLSRFERQTIVDETGLKGLFDVELVWTPGDNRTADAADAPSAPSLYTAVQEQLGLKLESRKGPMEILVVDHAEKIPGEN